MLNPKQQATRLLYLYGSTRTVLRGPVRGLRYVVRPSMGATYALGIDATNVRFLAAKIRPGATVFDIGANRGQAALFFARRVGPEGQVRSFEAVPSVFGDLKRNVALNSLSHVRPVRLALSDSAGEATLRYNPHRSTTGRLSEVKLVRADPEAEDLVVQTDTLDRLMAEGYPMPDVLKIDVEGTAAAVLRGAGRLLDTSAPAVYAELHGPEEQAGIKDELQARGYVVETLDGERISAPTSGWFSPLWCYRK